jgi:hypothetical protein
MFTHRKIEMAKIDLNTLRRLASNPEAIYKLHMAQARDSKRMFKDDPAMLAKIDEIIVKIKQTYKDNKGVAQ